MVQILVRSVEGWTLDNLLNRWKINESTKEGLLMTALTFANTIRLVKGLIPDNLGIDVYTKPTSNGGTSIELVNKKLNYGIDFCVYDGIGENTIAVVDEYTKYVRSMLYLQQFLDTLVVPNTSIDYKHDTYRNRVNFTRSNDSRHYALIETDDRITLVWVANIKTVNKIPTTCDIILEQWDNPVVNPTKTLKQVLDEAQDKTLNQLTDIS